MEPADADIEHHLAAFVDAFVVRERRERWRLLLSQRRRNTLRNSAKLMDHLDCRFCVQVDGAFGIDPATVGVFYDFHEYPPEVISLREAAKRADSRDAIFSIVPGRLALHWSHEDWSWLCRR